MHHKRLLAGLLLTALCLALSLLPAFAAVHLLYFKGEATADQKIKLTWETATEEGTSAFRVYRSTSESPSDWGSEICAVGAQGTVQAGYAYECYDPQNIEVGVRYYYMLREVTSNSTLKDLATTSAGVGLTADTPTSTASPTPTGTRTFTPPPTATTRYTVPTPTIPAPTATRKYTDAPPTAAPGTPTPRLPATATPFREPTVTPLPLARVASPTGGAPLVTLPVAAMPTLTPEFSEPATPLLTGTPAAELAALAAGPEETVTPLPTKDVTPIIFSAETRGKGSPTPQGSVQAAGRNSGSLALIIGGSAIGLAGLLAAGLLFLRSRRA